MNLNRNMSLETFLKTFSSNTKARIIIYYMSCKCDGCDVCTVYKKLGIKQANMSKHLGDLLDLGILIVNKDGKERKYKLNQDWYKEWKPMVDQLSVHPDINAIYCDCKHEK